MISTSSGIVILKGFSFFQWTFKRFVLGYVGESEIEEWDPDALFLPFESGLVSRISIPTPRTCQVLRKPGAFTSS